jgi:hypothetical protein
MGILTGNIALEQWKIAFYLLVLLNAKDTLKILPGLGSFL